MRKENHRVAVTVWNGRISPVFDVARQMLVLDVENGAVADRREEALDGTSPGAQASRLTQFQPQALICGAISRPLITLLSACGIRVIPFVAGEAEAVIAAYLDGSLPSPAWAMPGCCGGRRRGYGGGHGRPGRCYNRTGAHT